MEPLMRSVIVAVVILLAVAGVAAADCVTTTIIGPHGRLLVCITCCQDDVVCHTTCL